MGTMREGDPSLQTSLRRISCFGPAPVFGKDCRERGRARYERHRPEKKLLYQGIDEYYPRFLFLMEQQGRSISGYVQKEFGDYLKCGRLEYGFLRVRCKDCHHERLVVFSFTKRRRSRRAKRNLSQPWRQANG